MKVLLISGNHPRHLFVQETFLESRMDCKAIVMQREDLIPSPPLNTSNHDKNNFIKHFKNRYNIEQKTYGQLKPENVFSDIEVLYISPNELNSKKSSQFVKKFSPDIAFIFGPGIIKPPLYTVLPRFSINLHLGLSPWYKGSATLFWPFYFLEPQFAGVTFHQIIQKADAGSILHQSVPSISVGDGIHDVGANVVKKAKDDLYNLIDLLLKDKWVLRDQKSTGKLFLNKDFKPTHLRVIYDLFNDKIVDAFLNGELGQKNPQLIKAF